MTDLDKMARELLASACDTTVEGMQLWGSGSVPTLRALRAIRAALLTAPPGWKLVPVVASEA